MTRCHIAGSGGHMKKFAFAIAALLAVGTGSANATPSLCNAVAGNLLQNCGFESGDFAHWNPKAASSGSDFFVSTGGNSGSFGAFFGDTAQQFDSLFQGGIPTTPGHTYDLTYYFQSDGNTPSAGYVGYFDTTFHVLGSGSAFPPFSWTLLDFTFVATTPNTGIGFGAYDGPGFLGIDDVVLRDVTPVPEPFTLGVFGAGLAGAFAMRRRKRNSA